ncbi:MAG: hypothetical protein ACI8RD_000751, partial [Bacillariaceae sp.]
IAVVSVNFTNRTGAVDVCQGSCSCNGLNTKFEIILAITQRHRSRENVTRISLSRKKINVRSTSM